jgi:hypothetical protein
MSNPDALESDPVFIVGDGRSGTTLLAMMLDSHPDLACGPELHFRGPENLDRYMLDCLDRRERSESVDEWTALKGVPDLYAGVHFVNRCHRFGVEPETLRGVIEDVRRATGGPIDSFEERCRLVDRLGSCVQARKQARRWGIKIMRDGRIIDRYAAVWPRAQFVHIIRDGRDVAASQMHDHGSWGYGDVREAAERWADLIDRVRRAGERYPVHELRYEDLVERAEPTMRTLLHWLALPWHDAVLEHERATHALFEHPYGHPSIDAVLQPRTSAAIGRYRRDLAAEQVETFEAVARGHLESLGYRVGVAP